MGKVRQIEVVSELESGFIENVDPLTAGKTMYGDDVKGASKFPKPENTEMAEVDTTEQDEVAKGRKEPIARG